MVSQFVCLFTEEVGISGPMSFLGGVSGTGVGGYVQRSDYVGGGWYVQGTGYVQEGWYVQWEVCLGEVCAAGVGMSRVGGCVGCRYPPLGYGT